MPYTATFRSVGMTSYQRDWRSARNLSSTATITAQTREEFDRLRNEMREQGGYALAQSSYYSGPTPSPELQAKMASPSTPISEIKERAATTGPVEEGGYRVGGVRVSPEQYAAKKEEARKESIEVEPKLIKKTTEIPGYYTTLYKKKPSAEEIAEAERLMTGVQVFPSDVYGPPRRKEIAKAEAVIKASQFWGKGAIAGNLIGYDVLMKGAGQKIPQVASKAISVYNYPIPYAKETKRAVSKQFWEFGINKDLRMGAEVGAVLLGQEEFLKKAEEVSGGAAAGFIIPSTAGEAGWTALTWGLGKLYARAGLYGMKLISKTPSAIKPTVSYVASKVKYTLGAGLGLAYSASLIGGLSEAQTPAEKGEVFGRAVREVVAFGLGAKSITRQVKTEVVFEPSKTEYKQGVEYFRSPVGEDGMPPKIAVKGVTAQAYATQLFYKGEPYLPAEQKKVTSTFAIAGELGKSERVSLSFQPLQKKGYYRHELYVRPQQESEFAEPFSLGKITRQQMETLSKFSGKDLFLSYSSLAGDVTSEFTNKLISKGWILGYYPKTSAVTKTGKIYSVSQDVEKVLIASRGRTQEIGTFLKGYKTNILTKTGFAKPKPVYVSKTRTATGFGWGVEASKISKEEIPLVVEKKTIVVYFDELTKQFKSFDVLSGEEKQLFDFELLTGQSHSFPIRPPKRGEAKYSISSGKTIIKKPSPIYSGGGGDMGMGPRFKTFRFKDKEGKARESYFSYEELTSKPEDDALLNVGDRGVASLLVAQTKTKELQPTMFPNLAIRQNMQYTAPPYESFAFPLSRVGFEQGVYVSQKDMIKSLQAPSQSVMRLQKAAQANMQISPTKQSVKQLAGQEVRQGQVNLQNLGQATQQMSKQLQKQLQMQRQVQKQVQKTLQKTVTKPILKTPPTTPPPPPPIPESNLLKSALSKIGISQGFKLLVRREGKFKVVPGSFTKGEAILKGQTIVGKTLAATFKLEKAGMIPKREVPYRIGKEYREYMIRAGERVATPLQYIEKSPYRLSTRSEVQELQFFKRSKKSKRGGLF